MYQATSQWIQLFFNVIIHSNPLRKAQKICTEYLFRKYKTGYYKAAFSILCINEIILQVIDYPFGWVPGG